MQEHKTVLLKQGHETAIQYYLRPLNGRKQVTMNHKSINKVSENICVYVNIYIYGSRCSAVTSNFSSAQWVRL